VDYPLRWRRARVGMGARVGKGKVEKGKEWAEGWAELLDLCR